VGPRARPLRQPIPGPRRQPSRTCSAPAPPSRTPRAGRRRLDIRKSLRPPIRPAGAPAARAGASSLFRDRSSTDRATRVRLFALRSKRVEAREVPKACPDETVSSRGLAAPPERRIDRLGSGATATDQRPDQLPHPQSKTTQFADFSDSVRAPLDLRPPSQSGHRGAWVRPARHPPSSVKGHRSVPTGSSG
jgi:hypothetical protein